MTRALVIGYGSIGSLHARVLAELGCEVGVVSGRPDVHARTFPDVSTALEQFAADYVVVANETTRHIETVRALNEMGFRGPLLVEKPLRDTSDPPLDASKMPIHVGFNLRFHPALARLRQELQEAELYTAHVTCGSYLPAWRSNRDYRTGASASRASGGGVLRDLSHELDYSRWLFGGWRRLTALGGKLSRLDIETEDVMTILLETERCPAVTISLNYLDQPPRRAAHVTTNAGSFSLDLVSGVLTHGAGRVLESVTLGRDNTYADQHRALLSGSRAACCTLEEAEEVMAMIAATERAARTGTWITNEIRACGGSAPSAPGADPRACPTRISGKSPELH